MRSFNRFEFEKLSLNFFQLPYNVDKKTVRDAATRLKIV